ncbi:MAG: fused response regulator/phosphatase [Magnetococcus sp. YQC-5]
MTNDKPLRKNILIVDDDPQTLALLHSLLQTDYKIFFARNGQEALQTASAKPIDLILLDILMPALDGFAVCSELKKNETTKEIPIIFLTATTEGGEESKGLLMGAVDFIQKPINPSVLKARIKTHILLRTSLQELEELNAHLLYERETIEEIITNIQKTKPFDPTHIRVLIEPVERASGDLVLSTFRPDGGQHVMLGDFTGHGVTAAIGGPLVTYTFQTQTRQGVPLGMICNEINTQLCTVLRIGMFMAAGFLEMNPTRTELLAWNCGLHDLLMFRNNKLIQTIPSRSLPRGVSNQPIREPHRVATQPGDQIFIYSDGIIEERNGLQEIFGSQRLQTSLEEIKRQNQPLEVIKEILERFRDGGTQKDDISIVELTC